MLFDSTFFFKVHSGFSIASFKKRFFLINIYFWPCWVFVTAHGLLSSCSSQAPHCSGFSCCRAQALGFRLSSSGGFWA